MYVSCHQSRSRSKLSLCTYHVTSQYQDQNCLSLILHDRVAHVRIMSPVKIKIKNCLSLILHDRVAYVRIMSPVKIKIKCLSWILGHDRANSMPGKLAVWVWKLRTTLFTQRTTSHQQQYNWGWNNSTLVYLEGRKLFGLTFCFLFSFSFFSLLFLQNTHQRYVTYSIKSKFCLWVEGQKPSPLSKATNHTTGNVWSVTLIHTETHWLQSPDRKTKKKRRSIHWQERK